MGQAKDDAEQLQAAQYAAAKRDQRTCPFCGEVIPYGVEPGPNGEGPECVGALRDD